MVRRTVLDNGLRLISEEVSGMPSATVGIWVENGSRDEDLQENGVSHFLEHLFFKGTVRRTAAGIAEEIDAIGGVLDAFTGKEYTCYYARVLAEHLPLALDLLLDVFLCSRFAEEEIERERSVICQEIAQVEDTPDDLIHDLFHLDFWRGHPLSRPISGTPATIARLQRADLLHYLERRYRPDRIFVAMAGGARHEELIEQVSPALSALTGKAITRDIPPPIAYAGVYPHQRDLEQTHLCLGVPCVSQLDPNWYAAYLLHTALGGGMSSRLFQEIRERRGLAYDVTSCLSTYRDTGYLGVYVATSAAWVPEVVELISATLHLIAREGISLEELRRAKGHAKGGLLLGLETSEARMNRLARCEIYFGRYIPIPEVVEQVERVTLDEVRDLAARCFAHENRALTLLGELPPSSDYQALLDA
ncbi:MAG TPA: pitrilysin family protein [Candidatus Binatia bacterium]|jgi:predicted Zn-dependent peptidase|nr:pitrilysin family protein [Candidatus Binatia bacterium]